MWNTSLTADERIRRLEMAICDLMRCLKDTNVVPYTDDATYCSASGDIYDELKCHCLTECEARRRLGLDDHDTPPVIPVEPFCDHNCCLIAAAETT